MEDRRSAAPWAIPMGPQVAPLPGIDDEDMDFVWGHRLLDGFPDQRDPGDECDCGDCA